MSEAFKKKFNEESNTSGNSDMTETEKLIHDLLKAADQKKQQKGDQKEKEKKRERMMLTHETQILNKNKKQKVDRDDFQKEFSDDEDDDRDGTTPSDNNKNARSNIKSSGGTQRTVSNKSDVTNVDNMEASIAEAMRLEMELKSQELAVRKEEAAVKKLEAENQSKQMSEMFKFMQQQVLSNSILA